MPVYAADLLPDATGRNLGNPSQRWNANLQSLNVQGVTSLQPVSGQNITPGGVIYVLTSPITANTNTTAFQQMASVPVAAGLLNAVGKVLRCIISGVYTTQAGQTPGMGITIILGGITTVYSIPTPALAAAVAHNTWRGELTVTISTAGSAAMIETGGMFFYNTVGGTAAPMINGATTLLGPVDLTIAENLVVFCNFTTNSSPANVCILRQFIVEVLN